MNTTLAVRQDLAVLTEAAAAVAEAGLDIPVLVDTLTDLLATYVAEVAIVYLLEEDGVTLRLESLASEAPGHLELMQAVLGTRERRIDDTGLLGQCFATRRPVLANDIDLADFRAQLPEAYRAALDSRPPLRSILYVPLLSGGQPLGALICSRAATPKNFEDAEVELMCNIAELATPSIANAVLHERLAEMTALFETAFAHAPIGMAIHSIGPAPSRIIRANTAMCEILGRGEDELEGTPISALIAARDREDVDRLIEAMEAGELSENSDPLLLETSDGSTVPVWIDSRVVRTDTDTRVLLTQVQPLGPAGE